MISFCPTGITTLFTRYAILSPSVDMFCRVIGVQEEGGRMKKSWLMYCLAGVALLGGNLWAGKVVYPWRATTAFVKAGETFEVWYVASSGQTVNSVELKGPYNTVLTTRSVATGTWEYDHESGKTYNQKITVTVPANAPADRYDLVLKTSSGNETTPAAVKVLKDYKDYYYIVHMSDVHRYQGGYDVDVTLKKAEAVLDVADIVGAEMVWETGDQLYCHTTNNGETDNRINTMFSGKTGIRGLNSTKAAVFLVPGNHDSPKNNYTSDASLAVTMGWYNDKYGLGYFNFKYGNGRFMGVNSGMGSVPSEQRIAANAWLTSVGHGNLKLAAGHAGQSAVTSFDTVINLDMFLAGHNHFIASDNPHSINGKAIQYVANSIRDTGTGNFEYNLFRVKNSDGSVQVLGSTGSRVRVIQNHTIENINNPPSWIPMLELNFNNSNNGTA
ncbi:MAG: hypothetical protein FJ220_03940, partial [Kiritimatiellaceae bacterium]|nr:hypothetical protein [Kiritimatiellaceae bacterium]